MAKIALAVLIITSLAATGSRAEASESPLQNVKKIVDAGQVAIQDKISNIADSVKGKQPKQDSVLVEDNLDTEENIPKKITDPKEIERAAEFASEKTGVRKDFLMGMLTVESDLGRNPGKCTYAEVEAGAEAAHKQGRLSSTAWKTFQNRKKIIDDLAEELGYDAERLSVSCNPGNYAGTGGAMGVPQFMPDIWMYYKDKVGAIVGKENPDPWDARDGVVAMALLLADTPGVTAHNYYAERNSAKMYLSGTTSSAYEWYANQAFYWSQNYKKLLG